MSTHDSDWARLWTLFHQALEQPDEERSRFLDRACGGKPELRCELEQLLAANDVGAQFLERPVASLGPDDDALEHADDEALIGRRLDGYRVLGTIAEGGMGVVYDAEQEDPRRRVAIKLIRSGMGSGEVVARFESERQALALMNHPNIAQVYGAGATPSGRPYFAMEHVPGAPITLYCDEHRLSLEERLRLVIRVCDAVQHAHQKGVIHRDLKPSNILVATVDARAVPKIIDFGIAKAIAAPLVSSTPRTELGRIVGTLEYMSPEQIGGPGLDVDTRADIYALGVVLYELLTGMLPCDASALRAASLSELQRVLCETDPPRPSRRLAEGQRLDASARLSESREISTDVAERRRTTASALARRLEGDLDWITMKAIDKDRNRRYQTAAELGSDLERHLRHQPVLAGPPSASYRARKFLRRHRAGVTAAALVAITLGLGVAGTVAGWARARQASKEATAQAERATAIGSFLERMISGIDPYVATGRDTTLLEEIVRDAAARIDRELGAQPLAAAALHHTLGVTFGNMGRHEDAERHARRAFDLRSESLGADHSETLTSMNAVALELWELGRLDESLELGRAAYEAQRRELGARHEETLRSMNNLALSLKTIGHRDEAEALYRELVTLSREVFGPDHRRTQIYLSNLARVLEERGALGESEALLREVLASQQRTLPADDPDTLISLDILGTLVRGLGRLDEAERLHREALEGSLRILGAGHPTTLTIRYNLGVTLLGQGRLESASATLRETLETTRTALGPSHRFVASILSQLGECHCRQGERDTAHALFAEATRVATEALPPEHTTHSAIASALAGCLLEAGRYAQAEEKLLDAHARLLRSAGAGHPTTRLTVERLATLYERWSRPEEAARYRALAQRALTQGDTRR